MRFFLIAFLLLPFYKGFAQINLNQGLIAYYPFSGNANDASGNNLHGTVRNGAQLTTDRFNNPNSAFYFDGIDDYIEINDNGLLSPKAVTVSAMIKTELSGPQTIVGKIQYNNGFAATYHLGINYDVQYGYFFGVTPYTASCFQQYPYDPSNPFAKTTQGFSTNEWHCIVGTFQNSVLRIYVDGILADTRITSYNDLIQCNNTQTLIGSWWAGDNLKFKGTIDEVRIYDRAINAAEVGALCNTPVTLCTGSLGDPVVNISFGAGNNPGGPLPTLVPGATTTLNYVAVTGNPATPTPVDGQYTITNNVPLNGAWYSGQPDHTPNDVNGFMAFYNSQETPGLEFYRQTVNNLCGGTTYEFAAWVANCLNPAILTGINPDISFRIEKTDGTLIGFYNTGPISQESSFTWRQYGFLFALPAGETSVILKMINNNVGGAAQPGNDLAIDDITFRACGPLSSASWSNSSDVDTLWVCEGSPITLYGQYSSGYANPAVKWQQFVTGTGWVDILAASSVQVQITVPSTTGSFIPFRMVTAEAPNINAGNCQVRSNTIFVWVNPNPSGGIVADTVCANSNGHLTFTASKGTGPFQLQFRDPGGNLLDYSGIASGQMIDIPNTIFSPTTFQMLRVSDANGCFSTSGFNPASATIGVKKISFTAPENASTCVGKPVQLNGNNGTGYLYSWSPATFLDNPDARNPIATPTANMDYTLRITEPVCATDSLFTVTLTALDLPLVRAVKSNDIDCARPNAQLNVNSNGNTYAWTPVSGLSRTDIANPVASPASTTQYTVTARSQSGCTNTDTLTVYVTNTGTPLLSVPNAFTPNNDGKNDCFGISRWGYTSIQEFSIYNRWGQRVFQTKNVNDCWDGKIKGVLQPSGGYSYVIRLQTNCGEIKRTGTILLIR